MIIQQNAIAAQNDKKKSWTLDEEEKNADSQYVANRNRNAKNARKRMKKKKKMFDPVVIVPTSIEQAPLRRMDRRALNALRKRRSDKHMICCLVLSAIVLISAGVGAVGVWFMFAPEIKLLGPLVILGPILLGTGLLLTCFSVEICIRFVFSSYVELPTELHFYRLRKQVKRVMDPSLLKTSNFHEVKHWIEPELVSFGWGQYDFEEEADLLDNNHLRKVGHGRSHFVV